MVWVLAWVEMIADISHSSTGLPARSTIQQPSKDSVLNNQRTSNPFTPSPEPDWVTVSRPSSSITSTKLPPPLKPTLPPASTFPRGQRTPRDVPNPPSPSTASIASSTSSTISRKPAPPVPQKPALLSRSSNDPSSPTETPHKTLNTPSSAASSAHQPQSPTQTNKGFASPPPPRKASGLSTSTPHAKMSSRQVKDEPPLPTRRGGGRKSNSVGLMDEDDGGALGIPSLQPLQPLQRQRKG